MGDEVLSVATTLPHKTSGVDQISLPNYKEAACASGDGRRPEQKRQGKDGG